MKKLIKILLITLLCSCSNKKGNNPSEQGDIDFNNLKSPVILIGKEKTLIGYNITVKDSTDKVVTFGDLQMISNTIGESRIIGDTLK